MLHKLKRGQIKILTKRRPFSSKSKQGFYFGGAAEQRDCCINVISGVMSVLCGLRWGRARPGWLWAVDSLAVGWLSRGGGGGGGVVSHGLRWAYCPLLTVGRSRSHNVRWEESTQNAREVGSCLENNRGLGSKCDT